MTEKKGNITTAVNLQVNSGLMLKDPYEYAMSKVIPYTVQFDKRDLSLALHLTTDPGEILHAYGVLVGLSFVNNLLVKCDVQIARFADLLCGILKVGVPQDTITMYMYPDADFKLIINLIK